MPSGRGRVIGVGTGVESLVTGLLDQKGGARATEPVATTLGGYPATRIDLRIPKRLNLERCQMAQYGYEGLQVFLAQVGNPRSTEDRAELQTVLDSMSIRLKT